MEKQFGAPVSAKQLFAHTHTKRKNGEWVDNKSKNTSSFTDANASAKMKEEMQLQREQMQQVQEHIQLMQQQMEQMM
ncbi:hypothetical protein O6P43_007042 [Quillaja saponaria]|uniref:Uncharacterized protein n=1 Tax=Quillaja saponaria TaxID=32244 RepID=A0AAD7Q9F6_QUISA|nr:hypothetical protein O6P43_007042 [Quillaja saponaria]